VGGADVWVAVLGEAGVDVVDELQERVAQERADVLAGWGS
jgi:hypothetical protein